MSYINPSVDRSDLTLIQPGARVSGLGNDYLTVTVQTVDPIKTYPDLESEVGFVDTTGRRWFVNTKYSTDVHVHPAPKG